MKIPLSNRLLTCCSFVHTGDRVADVGCDHGYLGIHLILSGIADCVFEADINEGPLQSAVINAEKYHVKDRISFFLSDGLQNVPHDFDCLVCAGMGADTIISILEAAQWLKSPDYRLILQCQSKRPELRKYLSQQGYYIQNETLAKDGKFIYTVMEITYIPGHPLSPAECFISPALQECSSPLYPEFFNRTVSGLEKTVMGLSHSGDARCAECQAILRELKGTSL